MIDAFVKMFSRRDPALDARNSLARIISRFEMTRMSYREGLTDDRRARDVHNVAIGVWLFPQHENSKPGKFDVSRGIPAVTYDFRSQGVGVMIPVRMKWKHFVVATPDEDERWRFFQCEVRHNSRKPGGWYLLGLHVDSLVEIEGEQYAEFRNHVAAVCHEG